MQYGRAALLSWIVCRLTNYITTADIKQWGYPVLGSRSFAVPVHLSLPSYVMTCEYGTGSCASCPSFIAYAVSSTGKYSLCSKKTSRNALHIFVQMWPLQEAEQCGNPKDC